MPGVAHAQAADGEPPVIQLETVEEGVRGETQVFSATVSDNSTAVTVTLRYRLGKSTEFISLPMSNIQGTDIYTASIETRDSDATVIEYYLEAKDGGGNRTVEGFAFDPFERLLVGEKIVASESVVPAAPIPVIAPSLSTQRKIAYGLLGLLVVGGLASASGGSSGGSRGGAGQVDVKIVVDRFQ